MATLVSHLVGAWFALALPCYATYKALARPDDPDTLRALAAHWAVVAAFLAFEQSLGLVLSWLPFYWELRTLFLLYVSLPQTQGSAYVYKTVLEPWLSSNEADLDVAMASAQSNAVAFCRSRITALVDLVWSFLNTAQSPSATDVQKPAIDHIKDLWTAYAPSVLVPLAPKDTGGAHVNNAAREHVHQPYSTN